MSWQPGRQIQTLSIAAKYLMVLGTDPIDDYSPDHEWPDGKLNVELVSLANDNGVGDLKTDCLKGLREMKWTAFTAYGVGGPVRGITNSLFTRYRIVYAGQLEEMFISFADGVLLICGTTWKSREWSVCISEGNFEKITHDQMVVYTTT